MLKRERLSTFQFILCIVLVRGYMDTWETIENFEADNCKTGNKDITLWNMNYMDCMDECHARAPCTSINLHRGVRMCVLHMGDEKSSECESVGFLFSKKQRNLTGCERCNDSQKCEKNGSSEASCVFAECPAIDKTQNMTILGNGRTIGQRLCFQCDRDYKLNGSYCTKCNGNGQWSLPIPTCQYLLPPPWEDIGMLGSGYTFENETKTFEDAQKKCEEMNGSLAVIETEEENYIITNKTKELDYNRYTWIGLQYKISRSSNWTWVDDQPLGKWNEWGYGEPSRRGEDCVCLSRDIVYKWNDYKCTEGIPFVCEKKVPNV